MMRTTGKLATIVLAVCAVTALVTASADAHLARLHTRSFVATGTRSDTGIVVDQQTGDVYVASAGTGTIGKYSAAGVLENFSSPRFGEPNAVAVDESAGPSKGDVYVAALSEKRVVKLESGGREVAGFAAISASAIPSGDPGSNGFLPFGVAVDPANGDVVVADLENGEVDIFDESGAFVSQFTGGGFGVAVGADSVIFTSGGEGVQEWTPSDGYSTPTTIDPSFAFGLAVDLFTSRVLVDEFSQIAEYDFAGNLLLRFGSGDFASSTGVAINEKANTVYVGENAGGPVNVYGSPTLLADVVTGTPAGAVTSMTASVNGTVNPVETSDPAETTIVGCRFEYGLSTAYGATSPCSTPPPLTGSTAIAETSSLTGLQPNAIYHFRLVATNANAPSYGEDQTFTTEAAQPSLDNQSVSALTQTSVILNASLNPNNEDTTYRFEFGPSSTYGTVLPSPEANIGSGYGDVSLGEPITGLQPGTTYHYRVVASNATSPLGGTIGADRTFKTLQPTPPLVSTGAADGVSQSTASIMGSVNPQGVQSTYEFDLGVDTSYGTRIFGVAGSADEFQALSVSLRELTPGTTYHYRLIATNVYGTSYGADQTFTTPIFPGSTLIAPPAAVLTPAPPFPLEIKATSKTVRKPAVKKKKAKANKKAKQKGRGKK